MKELIVRVVVSAGARKEVFEKLAENKFRVAVKEKAERNAANSRVRTLLAAYFKVDKKAVRIFHGHHSKSKSFSVIQ